MTAARALLAAALCVTLVPAAPCGAQAVPDSVRARPLLSRDDAWFAAGAAAAVAIAATNDGGWSRRIAASDGGGARDAAKVAKQFGNHLVIAPALLAVDGAARLTGHARLAAATERVAFACASAGVVTTAIKLSAGRFRPHESSDPGRFEPFSGHDSFPSGHTTMAFSLAAAIDAETRTPWVPAVLYPAATLTAWSRVRDHVHWPSDVVAGAAIGGWVSYRANQWAQRRRPDGLWAVVLPQRDGASVRFGAAF
ncbi:MAG: phosphatase PAP2 family protein [Candidatus Eisenbacteria bacterium]|uniref:Phosphatase PAP2 family protein n=1 Tax=Eiseniibacteriota bacterium TaxID=2212470 RepID=A0A933SF83_UNCEI|nr:phosphatase PAP2 family protein [Candidatus Eisenbacteria bacterium]